MKIIIIILLLFILHYFLFKNTCENMHDYTEINISNKCCVINKKFNDNKVEYTYKVSNNCDGMYDNNTRTIKEGDIIDETSFSLENCNKEKSNLGSCRHVGFECIDFMTLKDCNIKGMTWSKLTCQEQLPVTIKYPSYVNKYLSAAYLDK